MDQNLTKKEEIVLNLLKKRCTPLSAYALLAELRDDGFRAPLQVYRALDKLIALHLVHKLESMNSYIACCYDHHAQDGSATFTICDHCGNVVEVEDRPLAQAMIQLTGQLDFVLRHSTIEMRGLCHRCIVAKDPPVLRDLKRAATTE